MKILKKTNKFIGKFWQEAILFVLILLFFAGTSSFLIYTQEHSSDLSEQADFVKWISPDETANYIFAKLFAQEGQIFLTENYNLLVDDIMRPRSLRSDHGVLKPVSFLGIILVYGSIASIFGYQIIPFLTPFFASIGLVFFYLLVRKLFGRQNAFWSTIFLIFFPPLIYYTARSMFHNVLFTVFLIIGLYFALLMGEGGGFFKKIKDWAKFKNSKYYLFAALSGTFFGLAIITRVSELLWLLPLLLILWLLNIRQAGVLKLAVFVAFLVLATTPMLFYNKALYGSMFYGGYPEMNNSLHVLASASTGLVSPEAFQGVSFFTEKLKVIKNTIFHFGFDSEQSQLMFQNYFVKMFYWLFWPALLGLVLFLIRFKRHSARHWTFLVGYFTISYILIVYYGSWVFNDNPDLEAVTIGNSYTRYWLPVYLGAIPFFTLLVMRLSRMFCLFLSRKIKDTEDDSEVLGEVEAVPNLFGNTENGTFGRNLLRVVVLGVVAFISIKFVLVGSEEGLVYTAQKARAAKAEWQEVIRLTESNSAIVTRYHDKLFFPERKVIVGLFDDKNMNDRYGRLATELPLYYYNFSLKEADIEYLNARRLKESGLAIELVKEVTEDFSLYRLLPAEKIDL